MYVILNNMKTTTKINQKSREREIDDDDDDDGLLLVRLYRHKAVYKTSEIQRIMDTKGGSSFPSLTW